MRPRAFAAATVGLLLSIGTAVAYHPADRSVRGTLEPEQVERLDFDDVQRGLFHEGPSSSTRVRRSERSTRRGADAVPRFLTEHHTR